jgi:RimJ/RimL family protein N-acetyltransferase
MWLKPVVLENDFVRLEPLEEAHRAGMRAAGAGNDEAFQYVARLSGKPFEQWFTWSLGRFDRGDVPFAVRSKPKGEIVGSTRFLSAEAIHKRLEVGFTWYRPDMWSGPVNPSCKLLLFGHAFDTLGANRMELKCDARNMRSRAAIAKLGAKQEGIFRHHMIMWDGFLRDSVYFSIIREEWPSVRDGLEKRLEKFRS